MTDTQRAVLLSIVNGVYPPAVGTVDSGELDSLADFLLSRGYITSSATTEGDPTGGFAATPAGQYAVVNE